MCFRLLISPLPPMQCPNVFPCAPLRIRMPHSISKSTATSRQFNSISISIHFFLILLDSSQRSKQQSHCAALRSCCAACTSASEREAMSRWYVSTKVFLLFFVSIVCPLCDWLSNRMQGTGIRVEVCGEKWENEARRDAAAVGILG